MAVCVVVVVVVVVVVTMQGHPVMAMLKVLGADAPGAGPGGAVLLKVKTTSVAHATAVTNDLAAALNVAPADE